ncbi:MAG: hypothetical protein GY820_44160 [Gammaproteobacteria bacterium]|nr:hypothetical protein [Gammaproteobacteria bacterium]
MTNSRAALARHFTRMQRARLAPAFDLDSAICSSSSSSSSLDVDVVCNGVLYNNNKSGFCHAWDPAGGRHIFVSALSVHAPKSKDPAEDLLAAPRGMLPCVYILRVRQRSHEHLANYHSFSSGSNFCVMSGERFCAFS